MEVYNALTETHKKKTDDANIARVVVVRRLSYSLKKEYKTKKSEDERSLKQVMTGREKYSKTYTRNNDCQEKEEKRKMKKMMMVKGLVVVLDYSQSVGIKHQYFGIYTTKCTCTWPE